MVECMFCKCVLETSHTKHSEKTGQDEDDRTEVSCVQNAKNPLKNWEKWMIKRTNINKRLSEKLHRQPGELLMNAAEEYREVKEEKALIENMKININFDKYRGNPAFWTLPPSLEENCRTKCRKKCPCEDPVYFAVKTFQQKNEIPNVHYIGISKRIFEEKNVLPRTRNIYTLWKKNPYRNAVLNKLRTKLKHLEPHRPDNSSLIVLGSQKISSVDRKERSSSKIRNLSFSNESESCNSDLDVNEFNNNIKTGVDTNVTIDVHDIDVVNLIINGTRIVPSQMQKGTMKIRVLYELEAVPKVPLTNYVKLENRGTATLRLHFARHEKYITFRDIIDTTRKPSTFYFDKRELLILPGKSIDFPIWFKPSSTGHFSEFWKVTTSPRIWSDNCNLLLVFQGIVYKEDFHKKSQEIADMLSYRTRNTLISDILREIINTTKYEKKTTIKYTYSEKHYFEAMNQDYWGATKRPRYLYNKKVLTELKNFYKKIKCPVDETHWNYSIKTLKEVARKRDLLDYIERLYQKCEKGQRRAKYLQQVYSPTNINAEEVQKAELAAIEATSNRNILQKSESQFIEKKETNYEELNKILQKLERPVMLENTEREKYASVYYIFRYYLMKIGNELSVNYGSFLSQEHLKTITKIEEMPERLLFEKFDVMWIERKRRVPPVINWEFPCRPKPKALEDLPSDKPQLLFDRYFKKTAPVKNKNEKNQKEPTKKEGKKGKNKETETLSADNGVIENFDPFADFLPTHKSQTMIQDTSSNSDLLQSADSIKNIQPSNLSYYEKYLIVYTNLAAGIDSMVAALETMKDTAIETQILSELTTCEIVDTNKDYNRWSESTDNVEVEESSIEETDDYFDYLMRTHLTFNRNTYKYFIRGENLPIKEDACREAATFIKSGESFQAFNPFEGKSDISDVKSGAMQTSSIFDDDYKRFSNILLTEEMYSEQSRVQSEQLTEQPTYEEEGQSSEIFYFVENGI